MQKNSSEEDATGKLLNALVQFHKLRGLTRRGNTPEHRCRHSEILILFSLREMEGDCPEGVSLSDLSRNLKLKSPTVTPAVYHLEKMGFVKRETDPNDRRMIRIRLTGEGNQLLLEHQARFASRIRGLVDSLGTEKSLLLAELLNEVYAYACKQYEEKKY